MFGYFVLKMYVVCCWFSGDGWFDVGNENEFVVVELEDV